MTLLSITESLQKQAEEILVLVKELLQHSSVEERNLESDSIVVIPPVAITGGGHWTRRSVRSSQGW